MGICLVDSFIYSIQYHELVAEQVILNRNVFNLVSTRASETHTAHTHTPNNVTSECVEMYLATVLLLVFPLPLRCTLVHTHLLKKIEQNGINFMEMSGIKERYQMKREQSKAKQKPNLQYEISKV